MAHDVLITTLDQIPPGEGRTFVLGEKQLAVFHTHDGSVYATQAQCPHLAGPLADGLVGGSTLMCPLHDRLFDLKTGCGLSHEHLTIQTFPLRLEADGGIWLEPAVAPV